MPFRKTTQKQKPRDAADKNVFDTAQSSSKSAFSAAPPPHAPPQPSKRKSAWLDAPLPQFYDLELAAEMVKQGYYPTLEEAYLDVPENRKNSIRAKIDEYLMSCRPPISWRKAPLPSPNK